MVSLSTCHGVFVCYWMPCTLRYGAAPRASTVQTLIGLWGPHPASRHTHSHQLLGPLPASHLPDALCLTRGRGVEPGSSLSHGPAALIHSWWMNSKSITTSMPGCAWPTTHTVEWPAWGRDRHRSALPQDATGAHTQDSTAPLAQSLARVRSAAEAGRRRSRRAPGTAHEPSLQAPGTCLMSHQISLTICKFTDGSMGSFKTVTTGY